MPEHPLLVCEGLCKRYSPTAPWALAPLDWSLSYGQRCAISGPSGAGKSTLLALLGLLDRPSAGSYFFKGQATHRGDAQARAQWRGRDIGFVFQNSFLLPHYTVLENLCLPLYYQGHSQRQATPQAKAALQSLELDFLAARYPAQISGGQRQRIALLRALITRPSLLLADEPTAALDAASARAVLAHLAQAQADTGLSLIVVTHDLQVQAQFPQHYRFATGGQLCVGSGS